MSGSILHCHMNELKGLLERKKAGEIEVPHILKFIKLGLEPVDESRMIPIDEAIKSWKEPIADMKAGSDQEQYNY